MQYSTEQYSTVQYSAVQYSFGGWAGSLIYNCVGDQMQPRQLAAHNVTMSQCPKVPMSQCPNVPMSQSPLLTTNMSQRIIMAPWQFPNVPKMGPVALMSQILTPNTRCSSQNVPFVLSMWGHYRSAGSFSSCPGWNWAGVGAGACAGLELGWGLCWAGAGLEMELKLNLEELGMWIWAGAGARL